MPRAGVRPYECVRRAWHSDTHQPIRGSIIQRIFRVVTEAHSSNTKKNREWQEKLPRVVLKAEEILYSKADSEAEYVDADTLWDRLNDAIDTIIRRDESTETGQFLQPCIEAALVLGCVPVRATRSQRHSDPRSYLNPRFKETVQASPKTPNNINNHRPFSRPPPPFGNQFTTPRPGMANQASAPTTSYTAIQNVHHYCQSFPQRIPSVATESKSSLNQGAVYPLYHSSHFPSVESTHRFHSSQNSYSDNVIIGRPVSWPRVPPNYVSSMRNTLPGKSVGITPDKNEQMGPLDIYGKAIDIDCDLSLRLGPSDHCLSLERHVACRNNDSGSSSHQETKNVELSLFPRHIASDPSVLCDNSLEREELIDRSRTLGKRKADDYHELGGVRAQQPPKLQHNQFDAQTRWPGW